MVTATHHPSVWLPGMLKHMIVELRFAYHAQVSPNCLSLKTNHPYFSWWWCDRGRVRVDIQGAKYVIMPGQWALLPIRRERQHEIEPGTVLISVAFQAMWATGMPLLKTPGPIITSGRHDADLRHCALQICQASHVISTQPADSSALQTTPLYAMQGNLFLFISTLFSRATQLGCALNPPGSGDERLDMILAEMNRDLSAGPLPLDQWAHMAGLSRSQLDRLCQKLLGQSLRQHRDRLLLEEIRQRLLVGSESVKQISAAFGFVDSAHFCRWVRQQSGQTPIELRHTPSA